MERFIVDISMFPITYVKNILVTTSYGQKKIFKQVVHVPFLYFVMLQDPSTRFKSMENLNGVSAIVCKDTGEWYLHENTRHGAIYNKPAKR